MKPRAQILTPLFLLFIVNVSLGNVVENFYTLCFQTKGCQGFPSDCVNKQNCKVAFSYRGISGDQYQMEILGSASEADYVASGLSTSGEMNEASVVACFLDSNSKPHVDMYWNEDYNSKPLTDTSLGLSNASVTFEDGNLYCKFIRKADTEFPTPTDSRTVHFDLNNEKYTLIYAVGSSENGIVTYHADRSKSSEAILLAEFNDHVIPVYAGCGDEKGCIGFPRGCLETKNCSVVATYKGVSASKYLFEVSGKVQNSTSCYVAVGLSQSHSMPDTSVVACSKFGEKITTEMYWNEEYNSRPLEDTSLGLSDMEGKLIDGYLYCKFVRDAITTFSKPIDVSETVTIDLNNSPYYMLLARGQLDMTGLLTRHAEKSITEEKIELIDYGTFHPVYLGCNKTKGCVGSTEGCIEGKNCSIVATFKGVSRTEYMIEIYGRSSRLPKSYVAMGLSLSPSMPNTSVIACSMFEDAFRVEMYWNDDYTSNPLSDTSLGLSNFTGKLEDDFLYCSVIRKSKTVFSLPTTDDESSTVEFDLNMTPYHVHLALGYLNGTGILKKHTEKTVGLSTQNFFDFNSYLEDSGDIYDGCGANKGCFGYPSGCADEKSCQIIVSFVTLEDGDVKFQMLGDQNYVALGLANSNKMSDASVMFCYEYDENLNIAMSWNGEDRTSKILDDPQLGLKEMKVDIVDGKLSCSFIRNQTTDIKVPGDEKRVERIDLSKEFYLLLASGPVSGTKVFAANLGIVLEQHNIRAASDAPVNLSEFSSVTGDKGLIVKWHGALMLVSWLLLACTGTLTARYGKNINTKLFGKDIWFRVHQVCMGLTWVLTLAAVIIMLVDKGLEPLLMSSLETNAHAALGITVVTLAFIQPFMAYFRPHPDKPRRPIFNIAHLSVGVSAIVLAFVAIGLATNFKTLNFEEGKYVMMAFSSFFIIFHLILTIYTRTFKGGSRGVVIFISMFSIGAITAVVASIVIITR